MNKWMPYVLLTSLCLAVGAVGGLATETGSWYQQLNKPAYNPPAWLFGPVWTALYILMGLTAGHIVAKKRPGYKTALSWFAIQLVFNVSWSFLFFKFHSPELALADILLLLIALVITIQQFQKNVAGTGYWLLPYLGWSIFATMLNAHIVWLN